MIIKVTQTGAEYTGSSSTPALMSLTHCCPLVLYTETTQSCATTLFDTDMLWFINFNLNKKLTKAQKAKLKQEEEERKLREQGNPYI